MNAQLTLYRCAGGALALPARDGGLVDRGDGGNLIVNPPREVWERSALAPLELTAWCFLVAAVGEAMLERLPQLEGGCLNYWEAGNWALHDDAPPQGSKRAAEHRSVHLHVFGRSRHARSADWRWGEAPRFPSFADRIAWARRHERLRSSECAEIVARTDALLLEKYAMKDREKWGACESCGYPAPASAHDCS